jgi:hypothetical protein
MTFKEYTRWCNDRAADGQWGPVEVMTCIQIYNNVKNVCFWKREKFWQENYAKNVYESITNPTNNKIKELEEKRKMRSVSL